MTMGGAEYNDNYIILHVQYVWSNMNKFMLLYGPWVLLLWSPAVCSQIMQWCNNQWSDLDFQSEILHLAEKRSAKGTSHQVSLWFPALPRRLHWEEPQAAFASTPPHPPWRWCHCHLDLLQVVLNEPSEPSPTVSNHNYWIQMSNFQAPSVDVFFRWNWVELLKNHWYNLSQWPKLKGILKTLATSQLVPQMNCFMDTMVKSSAGLVMLDFIIPKE